jgi:hypothetical protein
LDNEVESQQALRAYLTEIHFEDLWQFSAAGDTNNVVGLALSLQLLERAAQAIMAAIEPAPAGGPEPAGERRAWSRTLTSFCNAARHAVVTTSQLQGAKERAFCLQ